jgi:flagellar biosynthesis/type III secretory pathway M-ring protein FliF/YscJ
MTDQLQMLLRQLTIPQRISIAVAAFASLLLLAGFVMWAGKPDLQPAFTKLTTEQAGTVSEALRSAKIQFELTDGGATIMVPTGAMAAARVAAGGSADIHTVMLEMQEASLGLKTGIAVRDRLLEAYQEIMRLSI